MRIPITVFLCLVVMPTNISAKPPELDKLRQIAKLPPLHISLILSIDQHDGFLFPGEKPDTGRQISNLRAAVRGDETDAERYYHLGQLYEDNLDKERAKEAYAKAVELYRQKVRAEPENFILLSEFGAALLAAESEAEGEAVLRQAVQRAPQQWQCWVGLGNSFVTKAYKRIRYAGMQSSKGEDPQDSHSAFMIPGFGGLVFYPVSKKRTYEREFVLARDCLAKAGACFDRAVAVAEKEPQVYLKRAWYHFSRASIEILKDDGEPKEALSRVAADLRKAAELNPQDYLAVGSAAFWELFSSWTDAGGLLAAIKYRIPGVYFDWRVIFIAKTDTWKNLPEATRRSAMEAMKRLEDMTSRENDASATGAAETVAYFQLKIIHDPDAAARNFHRVVTLDPQNETAWDMLTICWGMADNDEQSITVSKQRLKHKESPHNHFMLAKAYERSNQLEQAEEEVRAALKLEPHDFLANLSLACLLLKRADNSKLLAEAKRYLDNAQAQSEHSSPAEKSDYAAARGLYFVLTGTTEEGKRQFQQSLKFDPENDQATRALEILKDD